MVNSHGSSQQQPYPYPTASQVGRSEHRDPLVTALMNHHTHRSEMDETSESVRSWNTTERGQRHTSNCLRYPNPSRNEVKEVKFVVTVEFSAAGIRS
jgi:hypothetical protein